MAPDSNSGTFLLCGTMEENHKKTVHQTTGKGAMTEALPDAADTSAAVSTLSKDAGKLEALDVSKMDHAGVNPISD